MYQVETLVQLFLHLCGVDYSLSNLGLVKRILDALLHVLAETGLHEFRNFFAEDSMAVTDREEVGSAVLTQVRQDQVRVLVHLVWVLRAKTCLCGERELCHAVVELLLIWLVV